MSGVSLRNAQCDTTRIPGSRIGEGLLKPIHAAYHIVGTRRSKIPVEHGDDYGCRAVHSILAVGKIQEIVRVHEAGIFVSDRIADVFVTSSNPPSFPESTSGWRPCHFKRLRHRNALRSDKLGTRY
jgi:hypothetical protein